MGALNEILVESAFEIRRAHRYIFAGTRHSMLDWDKIFLPQDRHGAWNRAETITDEPKVVQRYWEWRTAMNRRKIPIRPILDTIIDGFPVSSEKQFIKAMKIF